MADVVDLGPAGERRWQVVANVDDEQLASPTPCDGRTVGQLVQHLVGLTAAFRAAADKDFGPLHRHRPDGDGWPDVEPGWREALPAGAGDGGRLGNPEAWEGMTRAGGSTCPDRSVASSRSTSWCSTDGTSRARLARPTTATTRPRAR